MLVGAGVARRKVCLLLGLGGRGGGADGGWLLGRGGRIVRESPFCRL